MSGPGHDAIGAVTGIVGYGLLTNVSVDPRGMLVGMACLALLGILECIATQRQRAEERRRKAERAELVERGLSVDGAREEIPRARWHAPPKRTRSTFRLVAIGGTALTAWPVGVALAVSRLPDMLEHGPTLARWRRKEVRLWSVDHRTVTHWLLVAAAAIAGVAWGSTQVAPELGLEAAVASWFALGFATGWTMHLVADCCTLDGLPLFWPVYRRDVHLLPRPLRIRTGSVADATIMLAACVGAAYMAVLLAPAGWTLG